MNKALLKEASTLNHRHHEVMDRLEKIIDEGKSYKTMADLASMLKVSLRTLYEIAPSKDCLLYTSPSPRDLSTSRMPSSA